VRVVVVDDAASPRSGALVRLAKYVLGRETACEEGKTGPDGQVEFAEFPPGKPILSVQVGSHQRVATLDLVAGRVTEVTVVISSAGTSVEGTVRYRRGGPLADATVTLSSRAGWFGDYVRARTGLDGYYRLQGVAPNTYGVEVSALALGDRARAAGDVVVGSDAVRRDIEIGVISVSGVVRDSVTRQPIPGVAVTLQEPRCARCTTDTEGRYELLDISAGTGRLVLSKDGYELRFVDTGVFVTGEERKLDIDLHLAAVLNLYVADDRGLPVAGSLRLRIVDRDDPKGAVVSTYVTADASGHVVYRRLRPGSYELSLCQGKSMWSPVKFDIRPGDNVVHFWLGAEPEREAPTLRGTVRDAATGLPIPGASVRVRKCGAQTETDDRGAFEFLTLSGADQEVSVEKAGYGFAMARADHLVAGRTREVSIELKPGATLKVSVTTRDGLPMPKEVQLVFLRPRGEAGAAWGAAVELDEAHCASYHSVPPGRYRLYVTGGEGAARQDLDVGPDGAQIEVHLE
jgi:hypothetical protein